MFEGRGRWGGFPEGERGRQEDAGPAAQHAELVLITHRKESIGGFKK